MFTSSVKHGIISMVCYMIYDIETRLVDGLSKFIKFFRPSESATLYSHSLPPNNYFAFPSTEVRFTPYQRQKMYEFAEENPFPTREQKVNLARELGLSVPQVSYIPYAE